MDAALDEARRLPAAAPRGRSGRCGDDVTRRDDQTVTYGEAIRRALGAAMAEDETVTLLGPGHRRSGSRSASPAGSRRPFGTERVRDTPISEAATMGCGVGAAVLGLRPVVEVDFSGFLLLGFDQLVNNAAKLRYMSDGQLRVPLVVRVGQGPMGSFAAQHSQALHGWLANVPGLAVCAPSTRAGRLRPDALEPAAGRPGRVREDMRLYRHEGAARRAGERAPSLGAPRRRAPGRDATVVAFGHGVAPGAGGGGRAGRARASSSRCSTCASSRRSTRPRSRRRCRRTGRVALRLPTIRCSAASAPRSPRSCTSTRGGALRARWCGSAAATRPRRTTPDARAAASSRRRSRSPRRLARARRWEAAA